MRFDDVPIFDSPKHNVTIKCIEDVYSQHFPYLTILNSFSSKEGAVLLDIVSRLNRTMLITFIDTGRLPEDTLSHMARMQLIYPDMEVDILYPDHETLEALVGKNGINGFRDSVANRKECCHVRKVEPWIRHLNNYEIVTYFTGKRRGQEGRGQVQQKQKGPVSARKDITEINPLYDWTDDEIEAYISVYKPQIHPWLNNDWFQSLGCEPCSSSGNAGRSGRWWWEEDESKECGLHMDGDGI